MLTLPRIVERDAVPYVALKRDVLPHTLGEVGPTAHDAVYTWLQQHGIPAAGPPFFRYIRIDMERGFVMEFGVPTERLVRVEDDLVAGLLPAGRYASTVYRGPYGDLLDVNAVLVGWAKERGLTWDMEQTASGDRFACRLEIYRTDEQLVPDPAQWETEVAIRLAPSTRAD